MRPLILILQKSSSRTRRLRSPAATGLPIGRGWLQPAAMTDAIWRGDVKTVRKLVLKDPRLLHESARGVPDCNWGPPMSYAANIGQDAIIALLREMGAEDLQHAFDRACLQGQIETARRLHRYGRASDCRLRDGTM